MFGGIGPPEIFIIFLVILLLFGAKKIPEIAKGMGKGIREFKKAISDVQDEIESTDTTAERPTPPPAQKPSVTPPKVDSEETNSTA